MTINISLDNQAAFVTGAGSGLGLAAAQAFAEAGAAVALADRDLDAVKAAAEQLTAAGHRAIALRCDVADESDVARAVDQTVSAFGRLDAAYNNAGIQARSARPRTLTATTSTASSRSTSATARVPPSPSSPTAIRCVCGTITGCRTAR
ncbi:SDR family NAD(P)-dependent oxidoreductase [Streptomyces ipomoeae]|uniref:SDR family NAD(P)-dependent oxidoreductase n=1 Tax=Streptomyces ipomoeae TaxID=103232 RepID=UPI0038D3D6E2